MMAWKSGREGKSGEVLGENSSK